MGRVTQAHIDSRRETILDAATAMFVRKGFEAATMQEIATEADLSAGAIYRYFPSKEALLRAVCAGASGEISQQFASASEATSSPLEAILEIGRQEWEAMAEPENRDATMLYLETALAAARRPEELAAARRDVVVTLMREVEALILQAQESGEITGEVEARSLGAMLLAAHVGTSVIRLQMEELDPSKVFDAIRQIMRSLAPQQATVGAGERGG
jgi:AcrR family transcriptional regulator